MKKSSQDFSKIVTLQKNERKAIMVKYFTVIPFKHGGIHFDKFCNTAVLFNFVIIFVMISKWWQIELFWRMKPKALLKMNELVMWHLIKYYDMRHYHDDEIKI